VPQPDGRRSCPWTTPDAIGPLVDAAVTRPVAPGVTRVGPQKESRDVQPEPAAEDGQHADQLHTSRPRSSNSGTRSRRFLRDVVLPPSPRRSPPGSTTDCAAHCGPRPATPACGHPRPAPNSVASYSWFWATRSRRCSCPWWRAAHSPPPRRDDIRIAVRRRGVAGHRPWKATTYGTTSRVSIRRCAERRADPAEEYCARASNYPRTCVLRRVPRAPGRPVPTERRVG